MDNKKINVIAISGVDGVGKSTLATLLSKQLRANILPFADGLRRDILKYYPHLDPEEIYRKPTPRKIRNLLRSHSLERTQKDDLFWVKKWDNEWNRKLVIVDDVRFMREILHLEQLGCYHIHIYTPESTYYTFKDIPSFREIPRLKRRADYMFYTRYYSAIDMSHKVLEQVEPLVAWQKEETKKRQLKRYQQVKLNRERDLMLMG